MGTLAAIEKTARRTSLRRLRSAQAPSWRMVFLLQFLYAPFGISAFMFIPFFGQLLTFLCLSLAVVYVYLTGSVISLTAGLAGLVSSTILLTLFFMYLKASALIAMYGFLALAVIVSLAYLVFVSGVLLRMMEATAENQI